MSCLSYFMPRGHGQMKAQEPRQHTKRVKSVKVRKQYEDMFSTHIHVQMHGKIQNRVIILYIYISWRPRQLKSSESFVQEFSIISIITIHFSILFQLFQSISFQDIS